MGYGCATRQRGNHRHAGSRANALQGEPNELEDTGAIRAPGSNAPRYGGPGQDLGRDIDRLVPDQSRDWRNHHESCSRFFSNGISSVIRRYSATSGQRLGSRQYPNFSGGPLAVVRGGVWIPVQSTTTQSTTIRLFTGRRFTSSSSLGKFTFDTEAYVEGNVLWLIDSGGEGPTVCANPVDGKIRAEGSPVGVEYGAMTFDAGSTYILRTNASNQSLLKINPSSTCSR